METQEKDKKLISKFFEFDLSDDELVAFERRIDEDIPFKQKVDAYEEADSFISKKYVTNEELVRSDKWRNMSNKHINSTISKTIPWRWIGSIAAGLVLLFSIWQYNTIFQEPDMNQLVADSWNKNVGLGYYTTRSDVQNPRQEKIVEAFVAYKDKDYHKTIKILDSFKGAKEYTQDVVLLKALSTHKIGDSKTALNLLNTLITNTTSNISKTATWYKGLIYMDMGDEISAQKILEFPSDTSSEIKLKE